MTLVIPDQIITGAGTLGISGLVGFAAGYAMKKVVKIVLIVVGLFVCALAYLEYQKIITVNWTTATTYADNSIVWIFHQVNIALGDASSHITPILGIGFGAGAVAGFLRG